jgi:hypothetical protein
MRADYAGGRDARQFTFLPAMRSNDFSTVFTFGG